MSIYATIQFKMKNGQKAPVLHDSQCGEFRDTTLKLIKIYDKKTWNQKTFTINHFVR